MIRLCELIGLTAYEIGEVTGCVMAVMEVFIKMIIEYLFTPDGFCTFLLFVFAVSPLISVIICIFRLIFGLYPKVWYKDSECSEK